MKLSKDFSEVLFPRSGMIGINSLCSLVFLERHLGLRRSPSLLLVGAFLEVHHCPDRLHPGHRGRKRWLRRCAVARKRTRMEKKLGRKSFQKADRSVSGGMHFLERWLSGRRSPGSLALQTRVIEQLFSKGVQRPLGALKTLSGLHEVMTISTAVLRCSHSLTSVSWSFAEATRSVISQQIECRSRDENLAVF